MRLWRIDTPAQSMVLGSDDGMACCHYWGAPLPGDTDLDALVAAGTGGITGGMLDAARSSRATEVLVATEIGMLHQLRKAAPGVDFRAVNDRASCRYMKMITPAALLRCLIEGADEVDVDPDTARRARASVQRMIEIGQPGGGE